MNIETKQQQQQKHQKAYAQQQSQHQHQHHAHCSYDKDIVCDDAQMHKQKHQHHSHQPHPQSYQPCELSKITDNNQQQHHQHQTQPYQHRSKQQEQQQTSSASHHHYQHQPQPQSQSQTQRKYSHSPHHSRHTSPHSHHSHSLHSSPHQSHQHVSGSTGGGSGGIDTSYQSPTRTTHSAPRPPPHYATAPHSHHHHHHRRRSRRNHSHNANGNGNGSGGGGGGGGGSGGGSGNSSVHGPHGPSHHSQEHAGSRQHASSCSRRHRSATDISSVSLNTCHNENCIDREVQEIFVRKSCCSSSRTELAQYFAEDLYGSSRRPSSCCTSSDYCYQTDSTSLYGSRSSLSRNNSIKSATISMRRKRALHQRQPSYTSISLRGVQSSQPSSRQQKLGSLTTVFDRQKSKSTDAKHGVPIGGGRVVLSPSKVTIERQTSKDTLSQELPDYACSPSPIRWSFLADEKTQSDTWKRDDPDRPKSTQPRKPCRQSKQDQASTKDERSSAASGNSRRRRGSTFSCDFEESSTTVLFHQEGEAFNNCCNNYIQCNTYLDQDLQITSEDIHQYLSKGQHTGGDILNNTKNYPFQPSNALEFHYKNNFANNNSPDTGAGTATGTGTGICTGTGTGTGTNTTAESSEGAESMLASGGHRSNFNRYRRNSSKETNLNQNVGESSGAGALSQPSNINLSSSTNNINITFNSSTTAGIAGLGRITNEVKFINTASRSATAANETRRSDYMPYDCANVSSNSYFDKTLGIDELPKEFEATAIITKTTATTECSGAEGSSSEGQHSSPLPSPVQTGVSFESFDAPSDHNLISQRGSCQFSSPTPRSPLSPSSPACSSLSASVNAASSNYVVEPTQRHEPPHYYSYEPEQQSPPHSHHHHHHHHHHHSPASTAPSTHHTHSHHPTDDYYQHHRHHHHHANDSFKLSNAFRKVRKRARKYTDFLRKK